jgi:predicted MFS family arabinose efflux permease
MGLVGAALGIGFVIGPFLGGELGAIHERLPFYAVAGIAAANLVLAWLRLPESRPPDHAAADWRRLARALVPAPVRLLGLVHDRRIALYLYLFFHVFAAFAALEAMFPLFLGERFGLGERDAGRMFAWIGLFIAVTQGGLVGRLAPWLGEPRLVVVGLAATAAGLAAVPLAPSPAWLYAVGPLIAVGNGLALPAFTSLYSKACHEARAGEFLGQSQSMVTTGRIVGSLWAGVAFQSIAPGAPFAIAGLLMLVALALFVGLRRTLLTT